MVTALVSWSKPTPGAETSLATIRSTPLASQLGRGPRPSTSPVSAANPTSTWPGRRRPAELGQDVGGRLEDELGHPVGLVTAWCRRGAFGPEVGHRGGHDHDVGVVGACSSMAASISAAVSTRTTSTPAGAGRSRRGHQDDVGAPVGGGLGHGVALLARRAVGDEADRVDRLAGPAGADHDPSPGEVPVRAVEVPEPGRPSERPPTDGGHDVGRLGQASGADVTAGQPALAGVHHVHAPAAQRGQVVLDGGVLPHLGVHGRADHHRGPRWRAGWR